MEDEEAWKWAGAILATAMFYVRKWIEARRWREKGDHEYMNRMESGGRLYQVKRES